MATPRTEKERLFSAAAELTDPADGRPSWMPPAARTPPFAPRSRTCSATTRPRAASSRSRPWPRGRADRPARQRATSRGCGRPGGRAGPRRAGRHHESPGTAERGTGAHRRRPRAPARGSARTSCSSRSARAAWASSIMAEQEQPVRRKVALKVIKPGMDTAQVVARFEAERQALALMDHPNIAKVLDAGATDSRPPLLRDGAGQGRPDHRVLRRGPAHAARAAGAVRARLPGDPARRTRRGSSTATSSRRTSW